MNRPHGYHLHELVKNRKSFQKRLKDVISDFMYLFTPYTKQMDQFYKDATTNIFMPQARIYFKFTLLFIFISILITILHIKDNKSDGLSYLRIRTFGIIIFYFSTITFINNLLKLRILLVIMIVACFWIIHHSYLVVMLSEVSFHFILVNLLFVFEIGVIQLPYSLCLVIVISLSYFNIMMKNHCSTAMLHHLACNVDTNIVYYQFVYFLSIIMIGVYHYFYNHLRLLAAFQRLAQATLIRQRQNTALKIQLNWIDSVMPSQLREEYLNFRSKAQKQGEWDVFCNNYDCISILYSDIVGFTQMSSGRTASSLVRLLNEIFSLFDDYASLHNCEKISTLGDCYHCVAGCITPRRDHAVCCIKFGLDICIGLQQLNVVHGSTVQMRVGVHTGRANGAIIGLHRFRFGVYSIDVHIANLMEQTGLPSRVHISESSKQNSDTVFEFEKGESIMVKTYESVGLGVMPRTRWLETYFVIPINQTPVGLKGESSIMSNKKPILNSKISTSKLKTNIGRANLRLTNSKKGASAMHASRNDPTDMVVQNILPQLTRIIQKMVHFGRITKSNKEKNLLGEFKQNVQNMELTKKEVELMLAMQTDPLNQISVFNLMIVHPIKLYFTDVELEKSYKELLKDEIQPTFVDSIMFARLLDTLALFIFTCLYLVAQLTVFIHHKQTNHLILLYVYTLLPFLISIWIAMNMLPCCFKFNGSILPQDTLGIIWSKLTNVFNSDNACIAFSLLPTFVYLMHCVISKLFQRPNLPSCIWPATMLPLMIPVSTSYLLRILISIPIHLLIACIHFQTNLVVRPIFHPKFQHTSTEIYSTEQSRPVPELNPIEEIDYMDTYDSNLNFDIDSNSSYFSSKDDELFTFNLIFDYGFSSELLQQTLDSCFGHDEQNNLKATQLLTIFSCIVFLVVVVLMARRMEIVTRLVYFVRSQSLAAIATVRQSREEARDLLNNVLPRHVIQRLGTHSGGFDKSISYSTSISEAGVVFARLIDFFQSYYREDYKRGTSTLSLLHQIICSFDKALLTGGCFPDLEKIKLIGDTYMLASGLNDADSRNDKGTTNEANSNNYKEDHLVQLMNFCLRMLDLLANFNREYVFGETLFKLAIGYNSGPLVAGVISYTQPTYDIWGNTVNVSSRMCYTTTANTIQVPKKVAIRLSKSFKFEHIGEVFVKGKGIMTVYKCIGKRVIKHN